MSSGPIVVLTRTRPVGSGSMLYCDDMVKNSDENSNNRTWIIKTKISRIIT